METKKRWNYWLIKYHTDEARKAAITASKSKYMLNKIWIYHVCKHDYKLAGKMLHLRTKKHQNNRSKAF